MKKKTYIPCELKVTAIQCHGFLAYSTNDQVTNEPQLSRRFTFDDDDSSDE